jgi:hypothetical protein
VSLHFDFGGLDRLSGWEKFDVLMITTMTVGQVIFVCTWMVLPWWKEWVGRALMVKSATLALLLGLTVMNTVLLLRGINYRGMDAVQAAGYLLVNIGVWSQVIAIGHEIRVGNAERAVDAHRETQRLPDTRRFRPLAWAGLLGVVAGTFWFFDGTLDILSLMVVGVGVGMLTVYYAVSRPVDLDEVLDIEDEGAQ